MKLSGAIRIFLMSGPVLGISMSSVALSATKIHLVEKINYYRVNGNTGPEIFKDMLNKGPKINGRRGHFLAITEISYDIKNFEMDIQGGKCVTRNFDLIVKADYTYPKWNGSNKASSLTRRNWKKFSKEVTWHEKQHVKIAMDIAEDMAKVLNSTTGRTKRNCSDVSWKLGFKARSIGMKHDRLQKRFDRKDLRRGGRGFAAQTLLINSN